jgi:hypothetical protein
MNAGDDSGVHRKAKGELAEQQRAPRTSTGAAPKPSPRRPSNPCTDDSQLLAESLGVRHSRTATSETA